MKKYLSLPELILDYRKHNGMSQLDLASFLEVDTRTVSRWEQGTTLLNQRVIKVFIESLSIPHQVIHNLNSSVPIAIYYSVASQTYSINAMGSKLPPATWFKSELPEEDELIVYLNDLSESQLISFIEEVKEGGKVLNQNLLHQSLKTIPELCFLIKDQAGFNAGYCVVLKMNYSSYLKLKEKELNVGDLTPFNLSEGFNEDPDVFFFYVHRANSVPTSYYLLNKVFNYFRKKEFDNYTFMAIESELQVIELLRQMGLDAVWKDESGDTSQVLLEGDFDTFLFEG